MKVEISADIMDSLLDLDEFIIKDHQNRVIYDSVKNESGRHMMTKNVWICTNHAMKFINFNLNISPTGLKYTNY